MIRVAVVGLGSWGLCVLERLARNLAREHRSAQVHVIDPAAPGPGVYLLDQPDYLLLNTPCGQVSLYAMPDDAARPAYGESMYEWLSNMGYRWVGDSCRVSARGREISPHDYVPRRVMGAYLQWFFEALVEDAPLQVEIFQHRARAVDVVEQPGGRELVLLSDGGSVLVDAVVLATGHTANLDSADGVLRPYPVTGYVEALPASASVGIAGMGLVGIDVVTALTLGRGGSYSEVGSRLVYHRSGREPSAIFAFSRSGHPYCAKAVAALDESDEHPSVVCRPESVAAIGRTDAGGRRQVDLRTTMLPLLFAEMQARYYVQSAKLAGGDEAAKQVGHRLENSWAAQRFEAEIAALAARYGSFDAERHFFPPAGEFASSADYQARLYEMVRADLDDALQGPSSPVKSASEVLRSQRDAMRSVIEFAGLTLESYLDFQANIRSRVSRLVAGPPAVRSQQMLALMDAGVLQVPFGPAPRLTSASKGGFVVRSGELDTPHSAPLDVVIQGHLEDPTLHRSRSELLTNLYRAGRMQQFHYGDTPVGSVSLDEQFHPIDVHGRVQRRLWAFGALTEGVRYFTHYVPSPKSRRRVFVDADACVREMLA
ncbi:MAG: FAD/NAD(P)-binding protein [Acidimicrobiales bacterium]